MASLILIVIALILLIVIILCILYEKTDYIILPIVALCSIFFIALIPKKKECKQVHDNILENYQNIIIKKIDEMNIIKTKKENESKILLKQIQDYNKNYFKIVMISNNNFDKTSNKPDIIQLLERELEMNPDEKIKNIIFEFVNCRLQIQNILSEMSTINLYKQLTTDFTNQLQSNSDDMIQKIKNLVNMYDDHNSIIKTIKSNIDKQTEITKLIQIADLKYKISLLNYKKIIYDNNNMINQIKTGLGETIQFAKSCGHAVSSNPTLATCVKNTMEQIGNNLNNKLSDENTKLRNQVDALKVENKKIKDNNDTNLNDTITELTEKSKTDIQLYTNQKKLLDEHIIKLTQQLSTSENNLKNNLKDINNCKNENKNLDQIIIKLKKDIEDLTKQFNAEKIEKVNIKKINKANQQELQKNIEQMKVMKMQIDLEMKNSNDDCDSTLKQLSISKNVIIKDLEKENNINKKNINTLNNELDKLENQKDNMINELNQKDNLINNLQNKLESLQMDNNDDINLQTLTANNSKLEKTNIENITLISTLKNEIENNAKDAAQLNNIKNNLENEIEKLKITIEDLKKQKSNNEDEVIALVKQYDKKIKEFETIINEKNNLLNEMHTKTKNYVEKTSQTINSYQETLKKLTLELDEKSLKIEILKTEKNKLDSTILISPTILSKMNDIDNMNTFIQELKKTGDPKIIQIANSIENNNNIVKDIKTLNISNPVVNEIKQKIIETANQSNTTIELNKLNEYYTNMSNQTDDIILTFIDSETPQNLQTVLEPLKQKIKIEYNKMNSQINILSNENQKLKTEIETLKNIKNDTQNDNLKNVLQQISSLSNDNRILSTGITDIINLYNQLSSESNNLLSNKNIINENITKRNELINNINSLQDNKIKFEEVIQENEKILADDNKMPIENKVENLKNMIDIINKNKIKLKKYEEDIQKCNLENSSLVQANSKNNIELNNKLNKMNVTYTKKLEDIALNTEKPIINSPTIQYIDEIKRLSNSNEKLKNEIDKIMANSTMQDQKCKNTNQFKLIKQLNIDQSIKLKAYAKIFQSFKEEKIKIGEMYNGHIFMLKDIIYRKELYISGLKKQYDDANEIKMAAITTKQIEESNMHNVNITRMAADIFKRDELIKELKEQITLKCDDVISKNEQDIRVYKASLDEITLKYKAQQTELSNCNKQLSFCKYKDGIINLNEDIISGLDINIIKQRARQIKISIDRLPDIQNEKNILIAHLNKIINK